MGNAVRFCKALLRTTMIDQQSQTFQITIFYYHFSAVWNLELWNLEFRCSRNCKNEVALTELG